MLKTNLRIRDLNMYRVAGLLGKASMPSQLTWKRIEAAYSAPLKHHSRGPAAGMNNSAAADADQKQAPQWTINALITCRGHPTGSGSG